MRIGDRIFDTDHECYVMGILNVTPDSFSDGGRYIRIDEALYHAEQMLLEGADIIDVGGESTRPGFRPVSEEEEIARVVPVIEAIRRRLDVPVSIDTCKGAVAEAALQAGADLVNDVMGLKQDPFLAQVIARFGAACCLMHNRPEPVYDCFLKDVMKDLKESVAIAREAGIADDRIILDPGVGFGKTCEMNLEVIGRLGELKQLGYPLLLGASRKSFIGLTLELPVEERLEGTLAAAVLGAWMGCAFVRVHDVKENVRAIRMTKAILRAADHAAHESRIRD